MSTDTETGPDSEAGETPGRTEAETEGAAVWANAGAPEKIRLTLPEAGDVPFSVRCLIIPFR